MFTVTPSVSYSSLSGDVRDIVDAADGVACHGESDAFVWGLSVTFSFQVEFLTTLQSLAPWSRGFFSHRG